MLDLRDDLDPQFYMLHAQRWLASRATVIGGCCGTRPAQIARLRDLLHTERDVTIQACTIGVAPAWVMKSRVTMLSQQRPYAKPCDRIGVCQLHSSTP